MQTFLPYPNLETSLMCLDKRRLGKQRVEAFGILCLLHWMKSQDLKVVNALISPNETTSRNLSYLMKRYRNHPAVLMWKGYEKALTAYYNYSLSVFEAQGGNNIILKPIVPWTLNFEYPEWFSNLAFHASHRSNLLRKDKKFYSQFNWREKDNLPYVWPVKKGDLINV